MKSFEYTITDPVGIHARPAGILAKEAKNYGESVVTIAKGDKSAKASQLMKVMGLGVKQGDTVTISVEGGDEEAVCAAVQKFFQENF